MAMLFTTSYDYCFKQPSYLTFMETPTPPSSDVMCASSLEGNKLRARNETEMRQTETTYRPRDWPLNYFLSPGDKSNCNELSYFPGPAKTEL